MYVYLHFAPKTMWICYTATICYMYMIYMSCSPNPCPKSIPATNNRNLLSTSPPRPRSKITNTAHQHQGQTLSMITKMIPLMAGGECECPQPRMSSCLSANSPPTTFDRCLQISATASCACKTTNLATPSPRCHVCIVSTRGVLSSTCIGAMPVLKQFGLFLVIFSCLILLAHCLMSRV